MSAAAEPVAEREAIVLRPQEGPQEEFLAASADIVVYGGAAFAGKSFGLLLDSTRYVHHSGFRAAIFRRTKEQVRNPGGLWDESHEVYPLLGGIGMSSPLTWRFPSGSEIKFAHLEHEKNVYDWLGAQIPYIGFDQLEGFTEKMFWFLFGRNRSVSDIPKVIRATCNPKPDGWLSKLIQWWWDEKTGFAIPERSGVVRWFVRDGNKLVWADTRDELVRKFGAACSPTSFTFIKGSIDDNKIGMIKDPAYRGKLMAMPLVERMQLLEGNWKVRPTAGMLFKKGWFKVVDAVPWECASNRLRYWDRAATAPTEANPDPDWTVGTLMSRDALGRTYVEDVVRFRGGPMEVEREIIATATRDGNNVAVWLEEDGGSAGKSEVAYLQRQLAGYQVKAQKALKATRLARAATANPNDVEKDAKVVRSRPFSSQAEQGNVFIRRGAWNEAFLDELEAFPEGNHDDQVDSASGGNIALNENQTGGFVNADTSAVRDGREKFASRSYRPSDEQDVEDAGGYDTGRGRPLV